MVVDDGSRVDEWLCACRCVVAVDGFFAGPKAFRIRGKTRISLGCVFGGSSSKKRRYEEDFV